MKEAVISIIKNQIKLGKEEIENLIEIPPSPELGDYAFPCFILAEKLKKNPTEISLELAEKIKPTKEIDKIESAGPYLNFFVNKRILAESVLKKILREKAQKQRKGKLLIEHTSINPNASPHVGRARNAIIGDSIKRILEFSGYNVETHFYVNDVSKQIAMLALTCTGKEKFKDLLKKYRQASEKIKKNKKLEKKVFEILNKLETGDRKTKEKFKKIVDTAVNGQKKILKELGIKFDKFDYESDYLGEQKKILIQLKKTGKLFTDKEGRKVLDQSGTELEKQMKCPVLVLTRNDGTGLYPLRDIAYTIDKLKKAKKNLIVLGEDQKLYFKQLSLALKLLGKKSPEPIHYSFVLIKSSGKTKKMSTRKGDVVLLEDFIKEVNEKAEKEIKKRKTKGKPKIIGISAVKYSVLKNSPDKNIVFDLDKAVEFEGNTGPYILYSYARASSILRKSKKKLKIKVMDLNDKEIELIKKLSQFDQVVEKAEKILNPSLIANYSYELASIFNEFYHQEKVIGSEFEEFRLSLVDAFRKIIKTSLYLLGIEVLEEM